MHISIPMNNAIAMLVLLIPLMGCVRIRTEPVKVEPIEITMNVNVRIARELDEFFGDLDAESELLEYSEPGAL